MSNNLGDVDKQSLLPKDNNLLLGNTPMTDFFPMDSNQQQPSMTNPIQNTLENNQSLAVDPSSQTNFFSSTDNGKKICLSGFPKNENVEISFPLNKKIDKYSEEFVTLETFSLSVPTAPLNLPLLWALLPNISIAHTIALNKEFEIKMEGNVPENIQNLINDSEENKKFQNLKVLVLKYFFKGRHFHVRIYAKGEIQVLQVSDPNQFIDSTNTHPIQVKGYDMYRIPIECQEHPLVFEPLYQEAWIQYELLRNVIYVIRNVGHYFLSTNAIPIVYIGLRYTMFSSVDANNKNKKIEMKEKNKDFIDQIKQNEFYDFQIHTDGNYIHVDVLWNFRFNNRSRRKTIKINSSTNNPSQPDQTRRRRRPNNNNNNNEEDQIMEEFQNVKLNNQKYDEMDVARKIKYTNDIFEQNLKPFLEESKRGLLVIQQRFTEEQTKTLPERIINGKKEKFIIFSFADDKKVELNTYYRFPTKNTIQRDLDESIGNNTYPSSTNYFIFPYSKVVPQIAEDTSNSQQQQQIIINQNTNATDLINGEFIFGNVIVVEIQNRVQRICQIIKNFISSNSSTQPNFISSSNIPPIPNPNNNNQ